MINTTIIENTSIIINYGSSRIRHIRVLLLLFLWLFHPLLWIAAIRVTGMNGLLPWATFMDFSLFINSTSFPFENLRFSLWSYCSCSSCWSSCSSSYCISYYICIRSDCYTWMINYRARFKIITLALWDLLWLLLFSPLLLLLLE